jgi:microcystin-dependent protein
VQSRLSNIERNWTVPDDSITPAMLTSLVRTPVGAVQGFAGATPPTGWLICNGAPASRTTYAALFAVIGSIYGPGDGSTTFNLPDLRGRMILGVSGSHGLGTTGGAETAAGPAHTHPGSHSHGHAHTHSHAHTGALHTHPGSHSHGMANHNHIVDIDHNHPNQASAAGASAEAPNSINHGTTLTVTPTNPAGHTHPVDIAALGSTPIGSGNQSSGGNSTQADSNVFAASFSGNTGTDASAASPGTTDPDSNAFAASYSGTIGILNPFVSMNWIIYAAA